MSNESFDNKIRSKFEDFEPVFQEQDWQNFAPILHPKVPFWRTVQKPFAYAALAASIVFLAYQNNQLSIENKTLHSDNQVLKIEKQAIINTIKTVRDTVYISSASPMSNLNVGKMEDYNVLKDRTFNVSDNPKTEINLKSKAIAVEKTAIETKIAAKNISLLQQNRVGEQASISNQDVKEKNSQVIDNQEIKYSENKIIDAPKETIVTTTTEVSSTAIHQPLAMISTLDVPKEVHSKEFVFVEKPTREWSFEPSKIITPKVAKHRFAVGLNVAKQGHGNAVGVMASYQIFKHFEINTGISFHRNEGGMFKDDDDFRDRNKEEFKDKFHQPLPPNTQFTNIRSETKSIQVPVNVSFTKHIYRNLSYVASVGATLNINKTQHYDYLFSENGSMPKPGKLPLFNENKQFLGEAIVGTGVQYQWRNFMLRAEPTMSFNVQEMERRGRGKDNLGFRTQLYYRF
jgi:hypothetical protein